jgi:short-subunit dehydrogenase
MSQTDSPTFSTRGCTAIISGASSGLGVEFARQLADRAVCLMLAARGEDAMQVLASELKKAGAQRVIVCACDLSTDEGRSKLWQCVDHEAIKPTLLINNAGLGDYGAFADSTTARTRQQIEVNVTALTLLTHEFVRRVAADKTAPAGVLNVSSLASTMPIADLAVYAATKSYVLSFSEALNVELKPRGISVTAVCPGPTPTSFGKNARREGANDTDRSGQSLITVAPQRVVAIGLSALEHGKACVFPGNRVTLIAALAQMMPRFLLRILVSLRYSRSQARSPTA